MCSHKQKWLRKQCIVKDSVLGTLWLKRDPGWGDYGHLGEHNTKQTKHRAGVTNVPKDMWGAHNGCTKMRCVEEKCHKLRKGETEGNEMKFKNEGLGCLGW